MGLVFDLFGMAVEPRREGRGRPAHLWTVENSNKINLLFACGRSPREAAAAIGISYVTLYKVYPNECAARKMAALKMRTRQLERLNREAEGGNVAAEKALAAMIQAERVAVDADRFAGKPAAGKVKKGLKEQRRDAAWSAAAGDAEWDTLLTTAALPN